MLHTCGTVLHDGSGLVFVFVGAVLQRTGALEGDQAAVSGTSTLKHPPAAQHAQKLFPHVFAAQSVDDGVKC